MRLESMKLLYPLTQLTPICRWFLFCISIQSSPWLHIQPCDAALSLPLSETLFKSGQKGRLIYLQVYLIGIIKGFSNDFSIRRCWRSANLGSARMSEKWEPSRLPSLTLSSRTYPCCNGSCPSGGGVVRRNIVAVGWLWKHTCEFPLGLYIRCVRWEKRSQARHLGAGMIKTICIAEFLLCWSHPNWPDYYYTTIPCHNLPRMNKIS